MKAEGQAVLSVELNTTATGVASVAASKLPIRREAAIWSIMRVFAKLYSSAMPSLAILALAGLLGYGVRQGSAPPGPALIALALACVVACACRIALIAYIDVSAFRAISTYYLSPATPFVIVLVTLGLYLGYSTVRRLPVILSGA